MVASGTHVNGAFEDTAATVYTYDAEKKTVVLNLVTLNWGEEADDITITVK